MPKRYPEEFRRTVLDLVAAGRSVAQIAADLGVSDQTIYGWRRQELVDTGQLPGLNRAEEAELGAANKRIRGRPVGLYQWRSRPPSARSIRHTWLIEQIQAVHTASRGTYGARRVHAELTLGLGLQVGHNQIEMLMARADITGLPGTRRPRRRHETPTATDLVERMFTRTSPNQLQVTDITEHRTYEGKVYCAVVLDTFSRRVVGWSIDSSQTAALVTIALNMAIGNRDPSSWRSRTLRSRSAIHFLGLL